MILNERAHRIKAGEGCFFLLTLQMVGVYIRTLIYRRTIPAAFQEIQPLT